jgi:hypothetical protein
VKTKSKKTKKKAPKMTSMEKNVDRIVLALDDADMDMRNLDTDVLTDAQMFQDEVRQKNWGYLRDTLDSFTDNLDDLIINLESALNNATCARNLLEDVTHELEDDGKLDDKELD